MPFAGSDPYQSDHCCHARLHVILVIVNECLLGALDEQGSKSVIGGEKWPQHDEISPQLLTMYSYTLLSRPRLDNIECLAVSAIRYFS